eukprot:comp17052_c0_seq1/m.15783 comp17052_c0_seq1/g.15783  ORF comp17052_c0_seq1/g.15783 comp17052_c0_seq1/m.15783 type:complete len:378 (-) comp17052_c0_seq1:436-1569(-)
MALVEDIQPVEGFDLSDLDFTSLETSGWELDLDLKYGFDVPVPPTPPASCLPTPVGSPRLTGTETSSSTDVKPSIFDWSQAIMFEAFEDGLDTLDFDMNTPDLDGQLTPPRSPSSPVKDEPSVLLSEPLVHCKSETWASLPVEPEPEVAHINPSMLQAPCTPILAAPLALSTFVSAPVAQTETEEEDIDVETVEEHPFSDAQLLCLNQQLLLQQQQQAMFVPPPFAPLDATIPQFSSMPTANVSPCETPSASSSSGDDVSVASPAKRNRYTPYARPAGPKDPDHKRHTHNLLERRRREDLKTTFDMLSAVVPEVANDARVSKLQILQGATDQIRRLRDMGCHAVAVREALRNENAMLMERLRQMRANMTQKGVQPCV